MNVLRGMVGVGLVALSLAGTGVAVGQDQAWPDLVRSEASLRTAGRVATPTSVTALGTAIQPAPAPGGADKVDERLVATASEGPAPVSVMSLDSNMGKRVTDLLACRLEIAGDRRVRVDEVVAGTVPLRGTVRSDGGIDGPEVVALRDTDPEVLSCVKRKLAGWLVVRVAGAAAVPFQQELPFS